MPALRPQHTTRASTATPHSTSHLFSGQGSSSRVQQHSPDGPASATDTLAGLLGPGDDSHAMPFSDAACATAAAEEEALGDALAIEWKHEREILRENAQWMQELVSRGEAALARTEEDMDTMKDAAVGIVIGGVVTLVTGPLLKAAKTLQQAIMVIVGATVVEETVSSLASGDAPDAGDALKDGVSAGTDIADHTGSKLANKASTALQVFDLGSALSEVWSGWKQFQLEIDTLDRIGETVDTLARRSETTAASMSKLQRMLDRAQARTDRACAHQGTYGHTDLQDLAAPES